jgi:indolepyruvate decarboxylase
MMKLAGAGKSGAYIEIMGDKMDMPPALAFAHGQLKAMYGEHAIMRADPKL